MPGQGFPSEYKLSASCERVFKPFNRDRQYDFEVQGTVKFRVDSNYAIFDSSVTWVVGDNEDEIMICMQRRNNVAVTPSECVQAKVP